MALRQKWREGDYVKALDPPRLGLVLSVRTKGAGKVELLIEDAGHDCDGDLEPTWQDAGRWTSIRPAAVSKVPEPEVLPDAA